jgi:hypothetical protein
LNFAAPRHHEPLICSERGASSLLSLFLQVHVNNS